MSNYADQVKEAIKQREEAIENVGKVFTTMLSNNPPSIAFTQVNDILTVAQEIETKGADWGDYEVVTALQCIVETDGGAFAVSVQGWVGKYYGYTVSEWTLPQMSRECGQKLHEAFGLHAEEAYSCVGMAKSLHYALGLITKEQYEADHKDFNIEYDYDYEDEDDEA